MPVTREEFLPSPPWQRAGQTLTPGYPGLELRYNKTSTYDHYHLQTVPLSTGGNVAQSSLGNYIQRTYLGNSIKLLLITVM